MSTSDGPVTHAQLFVEAPRKIILVGTLGAAEITSIVGFCVRLHASGESELVLNLDGVTDCDRAGLDGLRVLASRSDGLVISVEGARWGQFMTMLSTEPVADTQSLCNSIRELVSAGSGSRSARRGRGRPPRDKVVWRRDDVTSAGTPDQR